MAPLFTIDVRHPMPLYAQIERGIRGAIATGRLAPGTQLPTVRQLAVDLAVNANTVARVYVELERRGLLETRRGVGTFVAETARQPVPRRSRNDAELAAVTRRFVDEAAARGFTIDDVVRHLRKMAGQGG